MFGLSWHEATIDTYLPRSSQDNKLARFEVGLYVGLTSFNVTFKGKYDKSKLILNAIQAPRFLEFIKYILILLYFFQSFC